MIKCRFGFDMPRHQAAILFLISFLFLSLPTYAQTTIANTSNPANICNACLSRTEFGIMANANTSNGASTTYTIAALPGGNTIGRIGTISTVQQRLNGSFSSAQLAYYTNQKGRVSAAEEIIYTSNSSAIFNSMLRSWPSAIRSNSFSSGNITYFYFNYIPYNSLKSTPTSVSLYGSGDGVFIFFKMTANDMMPLQSPSIIAQEMTSALQFSPASSSTSSSVQSTLSSSTTSTSIPVSSTIATSIPSSPSNPGTTSSSPGLVDIGVFAVIFVVLMIVIALFLSRNKGVSMDYYRNLPPADSKSTSILEKKVKTDLGSIGPKSQFDKTLEGYEKALEKNPTSHRLYYNKGHLFSKMNRNEDAVAEYDRAIKLNPKNPKYHLAKAMVLRKMGKDAEADKEYSVATTLAYEKADK